MDTTAINTVSAATAQGTGQRALASPSRSTANDFSQFAPPQLDPRKETTQQSAQQTEASPPVRDPASTEESRPSVGRIRFEVDDGTRVTKFFDTKDVLIYQVPPEGNLYLVRLREDASPDQVETSA